MATRKRNEAPAQEEDLFSARETAPEPEVQVQEHEEKLVEHAPESLNTSSGKFVKHNPMELFSARVIRKAHWESIGIYGQDGVEWNGSNNFRLPVELFSENALNYLLKQDDGFEVV